MDNNTFTTRNGATIEFTEIGFGGAPLGNLYAEITEADAQATLAAAWQSDVRYFDTAPMYGHGLSEVRFGQMLGKKPRGDYLLSTKVGRLLEPCAPEEINPGNFINPLPNRFYYDYSYDAVMRSFQNSLERLNLDVIDILYIHDVDAFTHGSEAASDARIEEVMAGGYHALVELREAGTIKAIGAGVNEWQTCQKLAERGDFDLFLLAGRYTLLEQEALESFLPLCEARGIGIIIGGPYNSGILATGAVPGAKYNYIEAPPDILARVTAIARVCQAHGVELIEAALHFPRTHPAVVSVIPGGRTPGEVTRNIEIYNTQIPAALWDDLKAEGLLRADAPTGGGR